MAYAAVQSHATLRNAIKISAPFAGSSSHRPPTLIPPEHRSQSPCCFFTVTG